MLTRAWMGHVSPEWTIRVGGHGAQCRGGRARPGWADADDRALVDLCLSGRRDAFGVIVERHRRQVYQLCYRYVGNHEDAANSRRTPLSARSRASTASKARRASGPGSIGLPSTSVSIAWRSRPCSEPLEPAERIDLRAERPDAALLRDERAAEVRAAIRQLPPKQRATLILRIYHDLPHEEIAGILGSSVGAAKANLFHALANLKKLLR